LNQVQHSREALLREFAALGWRGALAPYARRADAVRRVTSLYERGDLDESLYQEYLTPILGDPELEGLEPRSLVLIATPSLPVRLKLMLDDRPFEVVAAPGYLKGPERKALDVVREALAPFGFSAARVDGPQKSMATLSGFARYGRNNISYVPGLGTFHALATVVTDLPCDESRAKEQETLARCETCRACRNACPSGAIGEDRFLLHAERCITFWNEQSPDVPFPDWIDPDWHNALFGCMLCQRVCPENQPYLANVLEGPAFDEEMTRLLLSGAKKEDVPEEILPTLAAWRLDVLLEYMPRNLGVLVEKEKRKRAARDSRGGMSA
jgi:epoxyqueuosine reductase